MTAPGQRGEDDGVQRTTTRLAFGPAFTLGAGGLSLIALPDDILAQVRVARRAREWLSDSPRSLVCDRGKAIAFVPSQPLTRTRRPASPRRSRTRP